MGAYQLEQRLEVGDGKGLLWDHFFFKIFIDDIDENAICELYKFPDDTYIGGRVFFLCE